MAYFNRTLVERTASYDCYLIAPDFTPRKAGQTKDTNFDDMLVSKGTDQEEQSKIDSISLEQKETFRERLHYGRGDLSLQEWDDFLADLVDAGMISNQERMYANGLMHDIPESVQNGGTSSRFDYGAYGPEHSFDLDWTGDPVKWLNDLDLNRLKSELFSKLDGKSTVGIGAQRNAYRHVSSIIHKIFG